MKSIFSLSVLISAAVAALLNGTSLKRCANRSQSIGVTLIRWIFRCGTEISDEEVAKAEAHFQANKVPPPEVSVEAATIQVYFHVVSKDTTLAGGNVPYVFTTPRLPVILSFLSDSQITSQIQVINKAYAGAGISWTLAGTTRTVNSDWFNSAGPGASQQTAMKNALRVGGANVLNVYTVGFVHPPSIYPSIY